MPVRNITIRDEFDDRAGRFINYDCYDDAQLQQLLKQKHADIRSFVQTDIFVPIDLNYLETLGMTDLDSMTMDDIEGSYLFQKGEAWTVGSAGPQSDRNHWNGISLNCSAGTNITTSVLR